MSKKVVLVGHCGADSSYLKMAVRAAAPGADVVGANSAADLRKLLDDGAELVLVNRQVDYGFNSYEGLAVIREFRQSHPNAKLMMITNYPDVQDAAVREGAVPGFGKRELGSQRVKDLLKQTLGAEVPSAT